ncbi:MAG: hypothetical protein ACQGVK_10715 [Myxococcota bacterium]
MTRLFSRSALVVGLVCASAAAQANPVVSYGVQGGQPNTEMLGGVSVRPQDAVDVATSDLVFDALPVAEDLDAFHVRDDGTLLFSTTTAVSLDGGSYAPGDVVAYDGVSYSVVLDDGLFGTTQNIDAVTELPNGNLLISTSLSATLFGFSFDDGDVVEVDLAGGTAALYQGLDEAALFTGTNRDIDALHYDRGNDHLLLSVRVDGVGTIGGLSVNGTGAAADLFDLDLSAGISGSLFLDGAALYDGATRQLDAAYLYPQCDDGLDNDADGATDFPDDIGCAHADATNEAPACSDGVNNDPGDDPFIDFDGGLWALGYVATAPDPECGHLPYKAREHNPKCGLGAELALVLCGLGWGTRRRLVRRQV